MGMRLSVIGPRGIAAVAVCLLLHLWLFPAGAPGAPATTAPTTRTPTTPTTTRAAESLDLPELPSATELQSDVPLDQLRIVLRPMGREELEPVVEDWVGRLREKVRQISRARLGAQQSEGDEQSRFNRQAAELELERDRLADRVEIVLEAFEEKGGDASEMRQYVESVTRTDLEEVDLNALTAKAQTWLLAADGGIGVLLNIVWFVLILVLAYIVSKLLHRITGRALGRLHRASTLLREFLAGLVAKIVLLIGFVIAISFLGVNIGPLLAAIGAAGLVVGLALQGTLSNFASGILILLYRPYDVGDTVEAGGVSGKVTAMSLVSTTILTFDNQRIVVPNNNIWNDVITNETALPTRRVDMTFGVGYNDDLDRVMEILSQVCEAHPLVLMDPPPLIKVVGHGDSSVNVTCRPWVKTEDYWTVYWDMQKLVKQAFDREGISIPFPQRDVYIHGAAPAVA